MERTDADAKATPDPGTQPEAPPWEGTEQAALDAWRALGRPDGLEAGLRRLGQQLELRWGAVEVRVLRYDLGRGAFVPAGAWPRPVYAPLPSPSGAQLERWLGYAARGETGSWEVVREARDEGPGDPGEGPGDAGEVLAAPLVGEGLVGCLVFLAPGPIDSNLRRCLAGLVEPVTAALEREGTVHRLTTEREAAVAERAALLDKLGRRRTGEVVVGEHGGLREVMAQIEQVGVADVPVLLLGETGSGKEVVARVIHSRSRRRGGPFLRVNCGAISPELVDSDLFGHERGSFTGANARRSGWFERADGGTLFLDEVAELSPAAQVRLLRVLQDGTFQRVGGERTLRVDVRVIAATHRDLRGEVEAGRFRADLWYRLAVFPIPLPPLRDRAEDMPALAAHFAERASRRFGLPFLSPTQADVRLLTAYGWPGNVRELAAVIDRAAILGGGHRLEVAQALGLSQCGGTATGASHAQGATTVTGVSHAQGATTATGVSHAQDATTATEASRAQAAQPLGREDALMPVGAGEADGREVLPTLDEAVVAHVRRALDLTGGRVEGPDGAARLLGLNPSTLRARMRRLGIDWRRHRLR